MMMNSEERSEAVGQLKGLWERHRASINLQEKHDILLQFLIRFIETFEDSSPEHIERCYGDTTELTKKLVWQLLDTFASLTSSCSSPSAAVSSPASASGNGSKQTSGGPPVPPALALFEYLGGFSANGEGLYLLWGVEILTRQRSNTVLVAELAPTLIAVLANILSLPPSQLTFKKGQTSCPHISAFCKYQFLPISDQKYFSVEDALPSHLSSLFPFASSSSSASTSASTSLNSSPLLSPRGELDASIAVVPMTLSSVSSYSSVPSSVPSSLHSLNSIIGSLCYHILATLEQLCCHPETFYELVGRNKLKLLLDMFSIGPAVHKHLRASPSVPISPKTSRHSNRASRLIPYTSDLIVEMGSSERTPSQALASSSSSSTPSTSSSNTNNIVLPSRHNGEEIVINLPTLAMGASTGVASALERDPFGVFVVHRQMVRTVAKLLSVACHSRRGMEKLHEEQVLPLVLNNLWKHDAALISPTLRLELCQTLVCLLRQASLRGGGQKLFDDFITFGGYQVLSHNLVVVGKAGTKEEKAQFIRLICQLLFTTTTATKNNSMKNRDDEDYSDEEEEENEGELKDSHRSQFIQQRQRRRSVELEKNSKREGDRASRAVTEQQQRTLIQASSSNSARRSSLFSRLFSGFYSSQAAEVESSLTSSSQHQARSFSLPESESGERRRIANETGAEMEVAAVDHRSLECFRVLLTAFAQCHSKDMKSSLLSTIHTLLTLRLFVPKGQTTTHFYNDALLLPPTSFDETSSMRGILNGYALLRSKYLPLKGLFLQFDLLERKNQVKVLDLMDQLLSTPSESINIYDKTTADEGEATEEEEEEEEDDDDDGEEEEAKEAWNQSTTDRRNIATAANTTNKQPFVAGRRKKRRTPLLPEELRYYCLLLQLKKEKKPSSLLLVCSHLMKLIQAKTIPKAALRKAGLISILVEYLTLPQNMNGLIAILRKNSEERKAAYRMLVRSNNRSNLNNGEAEVSKAEKKDKKHWRRTSRDRDRERRGHSRCGSTQLDTNMPTTKRADPQHEQQQKNRDREQEIWTILYGLCTRMLRLLFEFLLDSPSNQKAFRASYGMAELYSLLVDDVLRGPALRIIAVNAITGACNKPSTIVSPSSSSSSAAASSTTETHDHFGEEEDHEEDLLAYLLDGEQYHPASSSSTENTKSRSPRSKTKPSSKSSSAKAQKKEEMERRDSLARQSVTDIGGGIVRDVLQYLQTSGGIMGGTSSLDKSVLLMRRDVLSALCYMFRHNQRLKDAFRVHGGFVWAFAVLNAIGISLSSSPSSSAASTTTLVQPHEETAEAKVQRERDSSSTPFPTATFNGSNDTEQKEEAFSFLMMLLNTLATVLTANANNQAYLRNDIGFEVLANALQSCHSGFLLSPPQQETSTSSCSASSSLAPARVIVELCDALLNMAVKGSWPPTCDAHSHDRSCFPYPFPYSFYHSNNDDNNTEPAKRKHSTTTAMKREEAEEERERPLSEGETEEGNESRPLSPVSPDSTTTDEGEEVTEAEVETEMRPEIEVEKELDGENKSALSNEVTRRLSMMNISSSSCSQQYVSSSFPTSDTPASTSSDPLVDVAEASAKTEKLVLDCTLCRNQLIVENPEMIAIIIRLLEATLSQQQVLDLSYPSSISNDKEAVYNSISCVISKLIFLARLPINQCKFAQTGLVTTVIDHFKFVLVPSPLSYHPQKTKKEEQQQEEEEYASLSAFLFLQNTILRFIQQLGSYHISLQAMRKYLALMQDAKPFPAKLLQTLAHVILRDNSNPYFYDPHLPLLASSSSSSIEFPGTSTFLFSSSNQAPPSFAIHSEEEHNDETEYQPNFWKEDMAEELLQRVNVPTHFLELMDARKANITLPTLEIKVQWPPISGYAIAFWFKINNFGGSHNHYNKGEPQDDTIPIISFQSSTNSKYADISLCINTKGVITLNASPRHSFSFDGFRFGTDRWYHVVVTHYTRSTAKNLNVAQLIVDGVTRASGMLPYPRSVMCNISAIIGADPRFSTPSTSSATPSPPSSIDNSSIEELTSSSGSVQAMRTQTFTSESKMVRQTSSIAATKRRRSLSNFELGRTYSDFHPSIAPMQNVHRKNSAAVDLSLSSPSSSSFVSSSFSSMPPPSWSLGNLYLFEEALTQTEALLLYMLGANYSGNLDLMDNSAFKVYETVNQKTIRAFGEHFVWRLFSSIEPHPLPSPYSLSSMTTDVTNEQMKQKTDHSLLQLSELDKKSNNNDTSNSKHNNNLAMWEDPSAFSHFLPDELMNARESLLFLFSARNTVMAQSFRVDGSRIPVATTTGAVSGTASLNRPSSSASSSPASASSSSSLTMMTTANSHTRLASFEAAPFFSPSTTAASTLDNTTLSTNATISPSSPYSSSNGSLFSGNPYTVGGGDRLSLLNDNLNSPRPTPYKHQTLSSSLAPTLAPLLCKSNAFVKRHKREAAQDLFWNMGGLANVLWFLSKLNNDNDETDDTTRKMRGEEEEKKDTTSLAMKQRLGVRLLHALLVNNARGTKEMSDLNGYALLARIMRKHRWVLDEPMLGLLFNLSGLSKSKLHSNHNHRQQPQHQQLSTNTASSSVAEAALPADHYEHRDKAEALNSQKRQSIILKMRDLISSGVLRSPSSPPEEKSHPTTQLPQPQLPQNPLPQHHQRAEQKSVLQQTLSPTNNAPTSSSFNYYYCEGIISNLRAFQELILNRNIWKRAPLSVQQMLFESLSRLVTTHEHAAFNILQFRRARVIQFLIRMFENEEKGEQQLLPSVLAPCLIRILRAVMQDPPSIQDFQLLMSYLVTTHPSPAKASTRRPYSAARSRRKTAYSIVIPVSKLRSSTTSGEVTTTKEEGSQQQASSTTTSGEVTTTLGKPIRIHVLEMLFHLLGMHSFSPLVIGSFYRVCSLDMWFALLQHSDLATRTVLLKILDLYLKHSSICTKFERMKGFLMLGHVLKNWEISTELMALLFCMLLGKAIPTTSTNTSSCSSCSSSSSSAKKQHKQQASSEDTEKKQPLVKNCTAEDNKGKKEGDDEAWSEEYSTDGGTDVRNFLGQMDDDMVLQHPSMITTILILVAALGESQEEELAQLDPLQMMDSAHYSKEQVLLHSAFSKPSATISEDERNAREEERIIVIDCDYKPVLQGAFTKHQQRRRNVLRKKKLQHSCIKTIHDIFLRNDDIKDLFLSNSLLELLCDIFAVEMRNKLHLCFVCLTKTKVDLWKRKQSQQQTVEADVGDEEEEEAKGDRANDSSKKKSKENGPRFLLQVNWEMEEDLLQFLKAIALYGCISSALGSATKIVDEVLLNFDMLKDVPIQYCSALKRKFLSDVLSFFHDNDFTKNTALCHAFEELFILALNCVMWGEEQLDSNGSTTLDGLPSRSYQQQSRDSSGGAANTARGEDSDHEEEEEAVRVDEDELRPWLHEPLFPSEEKFIGLLFDLIALTRSRIAKESPLYSQVFGPESPLQVQYYRFLLFLLTSSHHAKFAQIRLLALHQILFIISCDAAALSMSSLTIASSSSSSLFSPPSSSSSPSAVTSSYKKSDLSLKELIVSFLYHSSLMMISYNEDVALDSSDSLVTASQRQVIETCREIWREILQRLRPRWLREIIYVKDKLNNNADSRYNNKEAQQHSPLAAMLLENDKLLSGKRGESINTNNNNNGSNRRKQSSSWFLLGGGGGGSDKHNNSGDMEEQSDTFEIYQSDMCIQDFLLDERLPEEERKGEEQQDQSTSPTFHRWNYMLKMEELSHCIRRIQDKENNAKNVWRMHRQETRARRNVRHQKQRQRLESSTAALTNTVISLQQHHTKAHLQYLTRKNQHEKSLQQKWKRIVKCATHERAVWPLDLYTHSSDCNKVEEGVEIVEEKKRKKQLSVWWKLDPTEGMNRMRIRLKPSLVRAVSNRNGLLTSDELMKVRRVSALEIGKLYEGRGNDANHNEFHVVLKPGEKILLAARCQCITPFSTREGDILLSDSKAYFFDMSQPSSTLSTSSPETHRRRRKEKRKRQLQQQQKKLSLEKQDGEESEKRGEAEEERQQARGSWKKGVVRDQDEELSSTKETKQKKCKRTAGNTNKSIVWLYEDIKEIHKRRYLLKNTALEIFLTTGRTHLLAFAETAERDNIYDKLLSMDLPNRVDYESEVSGNLLRSSITDKWKRGLISNFEYLMHLNTLAGRSFNDLTQYPIFPFLLKDYTSDELDLTNPETFRDLSKPMGAQDPARLQKFVEKYQMVLEMGEKPYYYGSHYSNIGSVLYYLVRMNPFSKAFVEFQGGNFDVPDRSFHSLESTWLLSSRLSSSDVKELIPEFFYLPDFLLNSNDFDMGVKQNGWRVDDVMLPPWAKGSPRLFIQKHREALECRYVSERLHQWIDLMFGHLQSGEGARRAHNLFHPLTYEGAVDVDLIDDPVRKRATIAQISSYGQTPRQLFKRPHAERSSSFLLVPSSSLTLYPSSSSPSSSFASSEDSFIYLKSWTQSVVHVYPHPIASLAFVGSGGDQPLALPPDRLLFPNATRFVSWNHWDQNLRICSLEQKKVLLVLKTMHDEDVLCAAMTAPAGQYLVTGGTSSIIKVWKLKRDKNVERIGGKGATMRISLFSFLSGHYDHILSVAVSKDWNIIVSGSADGTAIIWDLNRARCFKSLRLEQALQALHSHQQRSSASQHRCYHSINGDSLDSQINCAFLLDRLSALRSFDHELRSSSPQLCVTSVAISKTTGNIFTVHNIGEQRPNNAAHTFSQNKNRKRESRPSTWSRRRQQKEDEETSILYSSSVDRSKEAENGPSFLSVWSINGRLLAATLCESRINCLALTTGVEGLCKNIVIGGLQNGGLRVWDSFDLTLLHDVKPHEVNSSSSSSSSSSPTSSSSSLNDISDTTTNVGDSSSSSPGSLPTVTVQTSAFPAITALCLNDENTQLLTGDESGTVLSWAVKRTTNPTQFIRNLATRQRRPSTAIPVSSSASSPIKTNSGNYSNAKDQLQQQQAQTETSPPEETPSNKEEEEEGN